MMRTGPCRFAVFFLMANCVAVAQHGERKSSADLPDAPSSQTSAGVESGFSNAYVRLGRSIAFAANPAAIVRAAAEASYKQDPNNEHARDFLARQLMAAQSNRNFSSTENGGVFGRAVSAASSTFISRTPSGGARLNTSYFLGVLTSAVIHTAYRPYWSRPVSAPFSSLGSTVGNDAGMNLLHQFGPGLQQLMKSHTPRFVSRIEAGIGR